MSSVSSRDSRSSELTSTKDGRPLRITKIRSCSCSTRSASSDRWALASENGNVTAIGHYSDLSRHWKQNPTPGRSTSKCRSTHPGDVSQAAAKR